MSTKNEGFSLIELLVAICIVVIVATIVVPVYMSIQTDAEQTVATEMQTQLNNSYANWKDSGGLITVDATTSDLLYVLGTPSNGNMRSSLHGTVKDSGLSNLICVSLPSGLTVTDLYSANAQTVTASNYTVTSSAAGNGSTVPTADPCFVVTPLTAVQSPPTQWTLKWHLPAGALCYGVEGQSFPVPPCMPLESVDGFMFTLPGGTPPLSGDIYGSPGNKIEKIHWSMTATGPNSVTWELWDYDAPK